MRAVPSDVAASPAAGARKLTVENEFGLGTARSATIAGMGVRTVQQSALTLAAGAESCAQQSWPARCDCSWQVELGSNRVAIITIATNARRNMPCAILVA
jgi:hypothetical protein